MLLTLALAGCASLSPTPEPTALPQPTVQHAGTFRISSPNDAITLDPAQANSLDDWWAAGALIFNQLYATDAQGRLNPVLASDFPQVSPDGLTLTIPLREGVTFHNGRAMTAEDVKFSLERVLLPETASWGAPWLMNIAGAEDVASGASKTLSGVKTLGPLTLQIMLKQPQAAFPAMLAQSAFSIVPRQETLIAGDDWGTRVVIGTGPFKLADWKKGNSLKLERNPRYFVRGKPFLDAVEITFNVAAPVALDNVNNSQSDYALFNENTEEASLVRTDESLFPRLRTGLSLAGNRILFNPSNRYAKDVRVRQAIVSAIDRAAVFASSGLAEPADGLLPPASPQYSADFRNTNVYDTSRAKALLREAGYPNGIEDMIIISREPSAEVQALRDSLTAAGIRTEWLTGDPLQLSERVKAGDVAIAYTTERMEYNDAFAGFSGIADCNTESGRTAPFRWCNENVMSLLAQAERLPVTSTERTALYQQMQDIVINQDVSQFVIAWRKSFGLSRDGVNTPPLHPVYGMPDLENLQGVLP